MEIENIRAICTACAACMCVCPKNAISIKEDEEGFYQPYIDRALCIKCNLCDKTCPELSREEKINSYSALCGYHNQKNVRMQSSSGGVFRALAEKVIAARGIVYGAAFQYGDGLKLLHTSNECVPLEQLQKSKYVQSYVGYIFRDVKKSLKENRRVLFVGTPCQVRGLLHYLGDKFSKDPNLITVDFICHGVPPMSLLKEDLRYEGFRHLEKIKNIDFRPKITAWVDYFIVTSSRNKLVKFYQYDPYYRGFNFIFNTLRKSCYTCKYSKGINRVADISLADYWGYSRSMNNLPQCEDGLSLVFAWNDKARRLLADLDDMTWQEVTADDAAYVFLRDRSESYPLENRNKFYKDLAEQGFEYAITNNELIVSKKEEILFSFKQYIKRLLGKL